MVNREPSEFSAGRRIVLIVLDALHGVIIVGAIVAIVVSVAAMVAPKSVLVMLGFWTGFVSLLALPGLVVLYFSPPRIPLRQRSALVASASWFGRTLWAGVLFGGSIVLGTVTGVLGARVSELEEDLGLALESALSATAQIALWPIMVGVGLVAFVFTGMRWVSDLGVISDSGGAHDVLMKFERRWLGETSASRPARLRGLASWAIGSVISRLSLVLLLITIGVDVVVTGVVLGQAWPMHT